MRFTAQPERQIVLFPWLSPVTSEHFISVGRADVLLANGRARVQVAGVDIAVFRLGDALYALDVVCPHRGGLLSEGDLAGHFIHCPLHAWPFDVRSGHCPQNPGARVRIFSVRILNGELQVSPSGRLIPF